MTSYDHEYIKYELIMAFMGEGKHNTHFGYT